LNTLGNRPTPFPLFPLLMPPGSASNKNGKGYSSRTHTNTVKRMRHSARLFRLLPTPD
jgi:hypothetical protein